MKTILTILILICSLTSFSQTDKVVGDYEHKIKTIDYELLEYKLTLSPDGTFFFSYYSFMPQGIPKEKNYYAKGKWTVTNNVVSFLTDKQKDLDEKHTLDFTNSKARFITKNPRDKTDRIIKTRLKFLESEIFWMERIEMLKI